MPRDSNGQYSLPAGTLVASGDTVLPSQHNPALNDVAAALTQSLARSGVGGMLADLNMNGNDIKTIQDIEAAGTVTAQGDITGGNLNIPLGNKVRFGSLNFYAQIIGGRPTIFFDDSNAHFIQYDPTANQYRFVLNGAVLANLRADGNLVVLGNVIPNGSPS